jgi:hypothetical protein
MKNADNESDSEPRGSYDTYLVHLTLISGEVEIPVHQTVLAQNADDAECRIRTFLQEFSEDSTPLGYLWYCYDRGAFAFKCSGFHRATAHEVIQHLRIGM